MQCLNSSRNTSVSTKHSVVHKISTLRKKTSSFIKKCSKSVEVLLSDKRRQWQKAREQQQHKGTSDEEDGKDEDKIQPTQQPPLKDSLDVPKPVASASEMYVKKTNEETEINTKTVKKMKKLKKHKRTKLLPPLQQDRLGYYKTSAQTNVSPLSELMSYSNLGFIPADEKFRNASFPQNTANQSASMWHENGNDTNSSGAGDGNDCTSEKCDVKTESFKLRETKKRKEKKKQQEVYHLRPLNIDHSRHYHSTASDNGKQDRNLTVDLDD